MTSDLTQPIKWHGGKHYLAARLIALFPTHLHYVEPYFGGGAVLLAKSGEGVSEVVNDLQTDLTDFWNVLANVSQFDAFVRIVQAIPFSEHAWQAAATPSGGPVERAVAFFIRARQSRQGLMKDFATLSRNRVRRGMNEQVSAWLTSVDGLRDVHARLRRVAILNRDAIDVIRQQDGPDTFFYLDPTYLQETRNSTGEYQHEMTRADHNKLLQTLSKISGKFLLSGYPSELYARYAARFGWRSVEFNLPNNASSARTKERKIERVWMNYDLEKANA